MDNKKRKDTIFTGSFWDAIFPVLRVSQIIGIYPLQSVNAQSPEMISFNWLSCSTFICITICSWVSIDIALFIQYNHKKRINVGLMNTLVFKSMLVCIYISFLKLARRSREFIKQWMQMEQRFFQKPYCKGRCKKLKHRVLTIAVTLQTLAVVEHSLFQSSEIYTYYRRDVECNISATLFLNRFPHIYAVMPKCAALVMSQLVSILATAAWNFLDLFIILISIGISTRFEQLTSVLEDHLKHEASTCKSIMKFRMDFIAICDLLAFIDSYMGIIVFLSAVNNLYFVCVQLLYVFHPLRYTIDYIYYWYSLIYLLGRTLYLLITAAGINEAAEGPKVLLQNIPSEDWNEESSRFLFQINSNTIALSAMGFCNFTRRLILTMAGAIVTFELVMMQFNGTNELAPLCG